MMNITDSLARTQSNIESHHADKISSDDAAIYKMLVEARKSQEDKNN